METEMPEVAIIDYTLHFIDQHYGEEREEGGWWGEVKGQEGKKKVEGKKEEEVIHRFTDPEKEGRKKKKHTVCVSHSVSFSLCLSVATSFYLTSL